MVSSPIAAGMQFQESQSLGVQQQQVALAALQPCRAAFYPRRTIIMKVNALFFINQTQKAPRLHSSLSCCIILRILNEPVCACLRCSSRGKAHWRIRAVPMARRNTKAACAYTFSILGHFRPSGPTFLLTLEPIISYVRWLFPL